MNNLALTDRTLQIHHQLLQDKVQAVGLYLEDASQFACVLLACLRAKIKVLLPPNLLAENRQWLVENSALLFDEECFANFGIAIPAEKTAPVAEMENETEIWLKTSGSSGQAKIIKKTARQMWLEAEALAQALPFSQNENILVIGSVSVQHLYGLTFRIFLPLFMGWKLGGKQLHYPEYLIAESKHHRTLWISSPALLSNLNLASLDDHLQIAGIISSGGALPEACASAIRQKVRCPLVEIYGSTETGVIAHRQQAGLWQPMPNSQIGLNEQGVLWMESPWIAAREQTADAVNLHAEGFELLGRIDRIVKLGDKRLSLVRLEQDLLQHSAVQDCYIALHPDHQRPVAWIALSSHGIERFQQQGRKALIAELRQHLSQSQEKFALPRYWRFSVKLPRNSQSKIRRVDFEQICRQPEDEII
ncbi:AMP-binding protein [[Haemophilus] felis]|nr:AMP-binding protein [[Haemophilus] felis]